MNTQHIETNTLVDEIRRYLEAVDVFRRLGHEPNWRPETVRQAASPPPLPPGVVVMRRAH